jgi:hypothetical protein
MILAMKIDRIKKRKEYRLNPISVAGNRTVGVSRGSAGSSRAA